MREVLTTMTMPLCSQTLNTVFSPLPPKTVGIFDRSRVHVPQMLPRLNFFPRCLPAVPEIWHANGNCYATSGLRNVRTNLRTLRPRLVASKRIVFGSVSAGTETLALRNPLHMTLPSIDSPTFCHRGDIRIKPVKGNPIYHRATQLPHHHHHFKPANVATRTELTQNDPVPCPSTFHAFCPGSIKKKKAENS